MTKLVKLVLCIAFASAFLAASVVAVAPGASQIFAASEATEQGLFLSPLDQRSLVYDAFGGVRATLYGEQNRAPVPLSAIPQQVIDAILDVEDRNFFNHDGINLRSTVRALFENAQGSGSRQGGSTITMQVVKSIMGDEVSLERKSREAVLALRLEEQLSKEQILERYLNTVYFGNGAYGVQAAAETYWGVGVDALDWGQAALLAALIRYPVGYDPIRFPEIAAERRRIALDLITDAGHITEEQAALYGFEPLPAEVRHITPPADDYFVEQVKQLLLDSTEFNIGATPEERYQAVFTGGLRVYTTFDPIMQASALQARNDILPGDLDGQFLFKDRSGNDVQGTTVVVTTDVHTGAVRALVGGPGYDAYRYNIATQGIGRQAGSSFKTFVLAAAMESGMVPGDTISGGGPCTFPNPGGYPNPYVVQNFGNSGGGGGSITSQTQRSSNSAYVRLGQIVGLQRVTEVARRMGITTPLNPAALSMPIGAFEVLPIEMAAAYASIANDGIYNEPYYIERITDADGNVLYQHAPDGRRALSRQSARLVAEVLESNVTGGTGARARLTSQPAGGKTGTAQDSADAWFVGFTPQYSTAVWMGATSGRVAMRNVGGIAVTGGSYPARIWGQYMGQVLEGSPRVEFADPERPRPPRAVRLPGEAPAPTSRPSGGGGRNTSTTRPRGTPGTSPPGTSPPPTTPITIPPPPGTDPPVDVGD